LLICFYREHFGNIYLLISMVIRSHFLHHSVLFIRIILAQRIYPVGKAWLIKNKVTTEDLNVTSLSQVLSQALSQACPKLERSRYIDVVNVLKALSKEPLSLKALMETVGEKNRGRMKENILQHLLDAGVIEPTVLDVPNSPKQKYALTTKGKKLL